LKNIIARIRESVQSFSVRLDEIDFFVLRLLGEEGDPFPIR
jgi:hypothetical protein